MMRGERYVVLGLARARSEWFRSVALWATSAAIPAEFVKCVSAEELRAHLVSGRPFSAVLVDAGLSHVDRDLLAAVRDAGCAPIVVDAPGTTRDWRAVGAAAVVPATMTREDLLDVLAGHSSPIGRGEATSPVERPVLDAPSEAEPAPVVAVCGPGGTGASTVAMGLAQGLASRTGQRPVLLADLCLRAEQAMLHDARDIVPGVQELVEAYRGHRPTDAEVTGHTFQVVERGYHLLLGLRRVRYWSTIRPRAFEAAFAGLRAAFGVVVADVTADFEGEDDSGSVDIEERNVMARTVVDQAAVVLAVGLPGCKGLHALVRLLADLVDAGVPAERIVPVLNCAPRTPRPRAELARALADLTTGLEGAQSLSAPLFVSRRRVAEAVEDGVALPSGFVTPLTGAYDAGIGRTAAPPVTTREPEYELVRPGSLGIWTAQEVEG